MSRLRKCVFHSDWFLAATKILNCRLCFHRLWQLQPTMHHHTQLLSIVLPHQPSKERRKNCSWTFLFVLFLILCGSNINKTANVVDDDNTLTYAIILGSVLVVCCLVALFLVFMLFCRGDDDGDDDDDTSNTVAMNNVNSSPELATARFDQESSSCNPSERSVNIYASSSLGKRSEASSASSYQPMTLSKPAGKSAKLTCMF